MTDRLDMNAINQMAQPLMVRFVGSKWEWPVYDIDVQTGLMRIDVMGKLDVKRFVEVAEITDADGGRHNPDDFWLEQSDED